MCRLSICKDGSPWGVDVFPIVPQKGSLFDVGDLELSLAKFFRPQGAVPPACTLPITIGSPLSVQAYLHVKAHRLNVWIVGKRSSNHSSKNDGRLFRYVSPRWSSVRSPRCSLYLSSRRTGHLCGAAHLESPEHGPQRSAARHAEKYRREQCVERDGVPARST